MEPDIVLRFKPVPFENGSFQLQLFQPLAQLFLFQEERVVLGHGQQGLVIDGAVVIDRAHVQSVELDGAIGDLFDKVLFGIDIIEHQGIGGVLDDIKGDGDLIVPIFFGHFIPFPCAPSVTLVHVRGSVGNIDMVDPDHPSLDIGPGSQFFRGANDDTVLAGVQVVKALEPLAIGLEIVDEHHLFGGYIVFLGQDPLDLRIDVKGVLWGAQIGKNRLGTFKTITLGIGYINRFREATYLYYYY